MGEDAGALLDIGALSGLTGVNTSTIRTWENRYSILVPAKSENGRRLYRREDIDRLVVIKRLLDRGHKISSLGGLPASALLDMLAMADNTPRQGEQTVLFDQLVRAIDDDDLARFRRLLALCVAELSPRDAVALILVPVLRLIGDLWHAGKIDVAQEHMLSEVIRSQLLKLIDGLKVAENGPVVAFCTLSRESHEFGALMACYLASSQRFRTVYLGADMPPADLARSIPRLGAQLVVVSSIYVLDANAAETGDLAARLGDSVPVWLGCDPAKYPEDRPVPKSVTLVPSLALFEARLEAFSRQQAGQGR